MSLSLRELLPLVCTLGFVTLLTVYMHKKLYNALKERDKPEKHSRSSLIVIHPLSGPWFQFSYDVAVCCLLRCVVCCLGVFLITKNRKKAKAFEPYVTMDMLQGS